MNGGELSPRPEAGADPQTLERWVKVHTFTPQEVMSIGIQAAAFLARLHATGRVFLAISPTHLLWSRAQNQLLFQGVPSNDDAGTRRPFASALIPPDSAPSAFSAPEQTGHRHRPLDGRTDLYALGATLYTLLSGNPPFEGGDPLELLHAQLARQPVDPRLVRPEIPPQLSAIVLKLLAKQPEDRYQAAQGLQLDLERLLGDLDAGIASDWALGTRDYSLQLPGIRRLYGRESETEVLLEALGAARRGWVAPLVLLGPAGIGKSALVDALATPVQEAHGHLVRGRCELQQDASSLMRPPPHQALSQALRQRLRQLLREPDPVLQSLRSRFQEALGAGAGTLLDCLPELSHFVQSPPALPPDSSHTARARMQHAFTTLLRVLASPDTPLVLFLDNLQWADDASLEMLQFLSTDRSLAGLLMIWAWRDGDRERTAALEHWLNACATSGTETGVSPLTRLTLPPLNTEATAQLVADVCRCTPARALPLAEVLREKTAGNPLYLHTLFGKLHADGLLAFDLERVHWDLPAIIAIQIGDSVVDLLLVQLEHLPENGSFLLSIAACLGPRFSLQTLADVQELPIEAVQTALEPAFLRGLVVDEHTSARHAHFAHVRILEAAYARMDDPQRRLLHRSIARRMASQNPVPPTGDALFALVGHYARCQALLDPPELDQLAALALAAAEHARAAGAHESTLSFCMLGLDALGVHTGGDSPWQRRYPLCLALHLAALEAAFFCDQRAEMERIIDAVLQHAHTLPEQAPAWAIRIQARLADHHMRDALAVSDAFLSLAGQPQPQPGNRLFLGLQLLHAAVVMLLWMGRRGPKKLLELPEAQDPLARAIQHIQILAAPAQLMVSPEVIPLTILRDVIQVLRQGVTAHGTQCWTGLAFLLIRFVGWMPLANRFGDLALAQIEKLKRPDVLPRIGYAVVAHQRHWTCPLRALVPSLERLQALGFEVGDVNFALMNAFSIDQFLFYDGEKLDVLWPRIQQTAQHLARHPHSAIERGHKALRGLVEQLRAETPPNPPDPTPPEPIRISPEDAALRADPWIEFGEALINLQRALIFGKTRDAFEIAQHAPPFVESPAVQATFMIYWTYASIALLEGSRCGWGQLEGRGRRRSARALNQQVRRAQKALKWWARAVPERRYRLDWIQAAQQRGRGRLTQALESFDRAHSGALAAGQLSDAALMAEQAGDVAEALGRPVLASSYRQQALQGYRQWNARAKVVQLESLLEQQAHREPAVAIQPPTADVPPVPKPTPFREGLDVQSILRASQALSEEIVYARLLDRILTTAIARAGAVRGALILVEETGPVVVARASVSEGMVLEGPGGPLETSSDVLVGLVHFVLRTGEAVVLADAAQVGDYTASPYVQSRGSRSLLCVPLVRGGEVRGAIYLENDLIRDCFTETRLEFVHLLASQAAISLENARLYERLEAKVKERTRELELARARAEEASQAKGDFLASMSHELRTPLNAILGNAQLLMQGATPDTPVLDGLRTIHKSGRHLLSLINDVLDMARIEAGHLTLEPLECGVRALLEGVGELLEVSVKEKGIRLELEVSAGVPGAVWVDEKRLRQVLLNLVGNAVKYTQRGAVMVRVSCLSAQKSFTSLRFEVQDTGVGIDATRLNAIFLPFEQAGEAEQRARGTGLGLPISQRIVQAMGGQIQVESTPGVGSRFWFEVTLPSHRTHHPGADAPSEWHDAPPPAESAPTFWTWQVQGEGSSLNTRLSGAVFPPRTALNSLYALALRGNLTELRAQASALSEQDACYRPFVAELERLADEFDDRAILALLETAAGEESSGGNGSQASDVMLQD